MAAFRIALIGVTLLLVCSIDAQGVSWSTIGDVGLRSLPVNAFADITAEQLNSIPPRSFSWITIAQISAIPPESFSGANSSHLSGLTDSCRGLTRSQVANIQGAAFAGIAANCFNEFTESTTQGLTSEHVINFSDSVCRGMARINNIPAFAFVSITPQCFARLSGGSCRLLTTQMLASISRTSLQALTSSCLNSMADLVFSTSTAELIAALPTAACSGMRSQQLANMNPPAANGFTTECISQFTWAACDRLVAPVVQNLSPRGVAGLTSRCIFDAPVTAFSTLPGELFAFLDPVACQGFRREHVRNFPVMAAAFVSPQCIGNFSGGGLGSACGGLTTDFVALLTPATMSGLGTNCMWSIPAETFAALTPQQYAAFSPQGCRGLSAHQASFFPLTAAAAFTTECIEAFGFSSASVCTGLRADFLREVPPEKFRAFTPGCMGGLSSASLQQLTSEHLKNFNPAGCGNFRLPHIQNLPPAAAPGLTAECLRSFSTGFWGACVGFSQSFVGNMTASTFSAFNASCISDTRRNTFGTINGAQIQRVPPQAFAGFDVLHMLEMRDSVQFAMSVAQVQHLTPRGFSGFRPAPLAALINRNGLPVVNVLTAQQTALYPPEFVLEFKSFLPTKVPLMVMWEDISFDLRGASWLHVALLDSTVPFTGDQIALLAPSTVAGLRADQISAINYEHFARFTPQQAQNFTSDMTAAFSEVQIQALPPTTFGNISVPAISGISASVIPAITVDQIAQMTRDQMFQMSCAQLQAFTEAQRRVFTTVQTANFQSFVRSCAWRVPQSQSPSPQSPSDTPLPTIAIPSIGISIDTSDVNPLLVGLLVPGLVLAVVALIIIIVLIKRRVQRRKAGNIKKMIGKPYYVKGSGWMQIVGADDENVMMVPYTPMT